MDLFTQHHICCDPANRKSVSHFHLNAAWPKLNELTKRPLIGHLTKLVIKYRFQVSVSDSLDVFTQHHMCCDIANRYTFPIFN